MDVHHDVFVLLLSAYACSAGGRLTKARHAEIFASVESADSIATRLKAALQSDARLAKYAEAV